MPNLVKKWKLFIGENGLVRSDGRIGNNKLFEYEVINPILLPKDHKLSRLIIEHSHLQVKYLRIQPTLKNLRLAGFLLTHPYQGIKTVINLCTTCQKYNTLSYHYSKVSNLTIHVC